MDQNSTLAYMNLFIRIVIMEEMSLILEKGNILEEIMLHQKVKVLFNVFYITVSPCSLVLLLFYFSLRQVTYVTSSLPFKRNTRENNKRKTYECKAKIRNVFRISDEHMEAMLKFFIIEIWLSRTYSTVIKSVLHTLMFHGLLFATY